MLCLSGFELYSRWVPLTCCDLTKNWISIPFLRLVSIDLKIQLDLIKNEKHRQAVAKLRSSNHKLRIEIDRYYLPKIPGIIRICQLCLSNKVENEIHFLFECNLYKNLRQHFFQDVEAKYSKFVDLNKSYISF